MFKKALIIIFFALISFSIAIPSKAHLDIGIADSIIGYSFGRGIAQNVKTNKVITCFTPQENCQLLITELIKSAKKTIYVQAYYLTNKEIISSLIEAANHGITVQILLDKSQLKNMAINDLINEGISILIDNG